MAFSERITLLRADAKGPIMLPLMQDTGVSFDFSMCNPPFYASADEIQLSAAAKELRSSAICTGAEVEMITPGGEEAFVALVTLLRTHSVTNYAITELVQGHTRRWALAWSFTDTRLPDDVARPSAPALRRLLPPRTTHRQPLRIAPPAGTVQRVLSALAGDTVSISSLMSDRVCVVAKQDTWSRSARRRVRARVANLGSPSGSQMMDDEEDDESERPVLLMAHVWVEGSVGENEAQLVVQWKQGHDVQAFESFASHIGRKIREVAEADAEVTTSFSGHHILGGHLNPL
ncbi:hypothetical protein F5148DRAFT_1149830 [Russula earlei]|uniref:Uncharacterized protein n=1 Tax=Russula earlei TaxID=71964 RepID=A0ACC0U6M3_9AGAM|nr:hypothetical protein F5148DRAFT_1149830 [Russula earlei]